MLNPQRNWKYLKSETSMCDYVVFSDQTLSFSLMMLGNSWSVMWTLWCLLSHYVHFDVLDCVLHRISYLSVGRCRPESFPEHIFKKKNFKSYKSINETKITRLLTSSFHIRSSFCLFIVTKGGSLLIVNTFSSFSGLVLSPLLHFSDNS